MRKPIREGDSAHARAEAIPKHTREGWSVLCGVLPSFPISLSLSFCFFSFSLFGSVRPGDPACLCSRNFPIFLKRNLTQKEPSRGTRCTQAYPGEGEEAQRERARKRDKMKKKTTKTAISSVHLAFRYIRPAFSYSSHLIFMPKEAHSPSTHPSSRTTIIIFFVIFYTVSELKTRNSYSEIRTAKRFTFYQRPIFSVVLELPTVQISRLFILKNKMENCLSSEG